jgi:secreted PhoX family phosphatase
VVPGQGQWTPALVTSGNAVLVPFRLELTITSLNTGESSTFSVSKQAAEVTATTTCRFEQTFTNPQTGETHRVVGVLEVLRQPSASSG